jgi:hypothetical protein
MRGGCPARLHKQYWQFWPAGVATDAHGHRLRAGEIAQSGSCCAASAFASRCAKDRILRSPAELHAASSSKTQAGEERKLDRFGANAVAQICHLDDDGALPHGSRLHQRAEPRWHRAACCGAREFLRRGPLSSGLRPEFGE